MKFTPYQNAVYGDESRKFIIHLDKQYRFHVRDIADGIICDLKGVEKIHYFYGTMEIEYIPGATSVREILQHLSQRGVQGSVVLDELPGHQQTAAAKHTAGAVPEGVEPPRRAKALALFLLSRKFSDGTIGDLDQLYRDEARELYSRRGADLWYWAQIINLIRHNAQEGLRKLVIRALQLAGLGSLVALFDKLRGWWS